MITLTLRMESFRKLRASRKQVHKHEFMFPIKAR